MKRSSLSVCLALAVAVLLCMEPAANALVHRLRTNTVKRPLNNKHAGKGHHKGRHAAPIRQSPLELLKSHHSGDLDILKLKQQRAAAKLNNVGSLSLDLEYSTTLVADIDIGTPQQGEFAVEVAFDNDQLYVLDSKAKYSDRQGKVHDKQTLNTTKSNTYAADANAEFTPFDFYYKGEVGNDTVMFGGMSVNASLQVTTKVDYNLAYYDIDGSMGLAVSDDSSFVSQLAPILDSPLLTIYTNASEDFTSDNFGSGTLTFGSIEPSVCNSNAWTKLPASWSGFYPGYPTIQSASIVAPAESNGCANAVVANITAMFYYDFIPLYVSNQVHDLLVKASGAVYDSDWGLFTVDDVSKAQPLTMRLSNGATIDILPQDYLIRYEGVDILYALGYYDQNMYVDGDYIFLPRQLLNNRCLSMSLQTGEWSLTTVNQPTETVFQASSSSDSDSIGYTSSSSDSDWSTSSE